MIDSIGKPGIVGVTSGVGNEEVVLAVVRDCGCGVVVVVVTADSLLVGWVWLEVLLDARLDVVGVVIVELPVELLAVVVTT
jgi:hypothetical protein